MTVRKVCSYPCPDIANNRTDRDVLRKHLLEGHQCLDGWLALSQVVNDPRQRRDCLLRAVELAPEEREIQIAYFDACLVVDPGNQQIQQMLSELRTLQMLSGVKTSHFHPPERVRQLGDILVSLNALTQEQLNEILSAQRNGSVTDRHRKLGQMLVNRGVISPAMLARALIVQAQERSNLRMAPQVLGEFLVERGYITTQDLELALTEQIRLDQQDKHFSLGQILIHLRMLRPEVVNKAVHEQELLFWDKFGY